MKVLQLALLLGITIMLAGCGKEDEQSVIPGYLKPGEFRPKGMLGYGGEFPKSYTLTDGALGGDGSCSGMGCLAVYALWSTDNIPVEGVAIKDNDTANSRLLLKMTRVKGTDWQIRLLYDGTAYKNTLVPAGDIGLEFCTTTIPTLPGYTDPSGTVLDPSDIFIVRATITINNPIQLKTDETVPKIITLNAGDRIVAQAYNARGTSACTP